MGGWEDERANEWAVEQMGGLDSGHVGGWAGEGGRLCEWANGPNGHFDG